MGKKRVRYHPKDGRLLILFPMDGQNYNYRESPLLNYFS